jgi:hypothetical protein
MSLNKPNPVSTTRLLIGMMINLVDDANVCATIHGYRGNSSILKIDVERLLIS